MNQKNLFPLNPLDIKVADTHEPEFFAQEFHAAVNFGAMADGIKTVDVDSAFGKDVGTVYGIVALTTKGAGDNEVLAFSAAAHATTEGKITVTMHSSDATATDDLTLSFWLFGRPKFTSITY